MSSIRVWGLAGLVWLSTAGVAHAQDRREAPPDAAPAEPTTTPPPTVIIVQPPPAAPVQLQPPTPPPAPAVTSRSSQGNAGVGVGFFALSPTGEHTSYRGDAAVTLQSRRVFGLSPQFGLEAVTSVVFHDWETMGDAYDWYFSDTDEDPNRSNVGAKLLFLWPGLIIVPFFGANLGLGVGGIVYLTPKAPSFFIDAGAELQMMLRPSDPDFIFDLGLGVYGGFGFELSDTMSLSVRTTYVPPLFHAVHETDRDLRAITMSATVEFVAR